MKPEYFKKIPATLKMFSDFLGDKDWLMGNKVKGGLWETR